jgi:L-ascorbate metabolism protein UlaG (beta-lactamase superfamily)
MAFKTTGRQPSGEHLERLKRSPNFKGRGFANISGTPMMAEDASYLKMLMDYFNKPKNGIPASPIPTVRTDLININDAEASLVWFGHSSYLLRIAGKIILVDPVFSGNAAPVNFMVKAFPGSNIYQVDDLPPIDYLIITHDHYDHLDYRTIKQLKGKFKKVFCSLGVGSHLAYWGVDPAIITELDWWEETEPDKGIQLVATPARHFSGRGIKRNQTLWNSYIIKAPGITVYIGGDSGYDIHFKQIGEKFGVIDLAILEAGQYNTMWPLIHMMPEETVQAAIDLNARAMMPVHWGKFMLAMHEWNEPVKRIIKKADELGMAVVTPRIGEPLAIKSGLKGEAWWELI